MRTATWAGIGTDVTSCTNIGSVLKESGLDYNVIKRPILTDNGISIDGRVATVDEKNNRVLGIVSEKYEICQNEAAFDFVDLIEKDLKFVKAGETHSGLVYIIAELPEYNILGDTFKPYAIFQNGHNGGISLKTAICPLRIVCQNQFNMAFGDKANNSITIRHTSNLHDKLSEAQKVLRYSTDYMKQLSIEAEKFAGIKMSPNQVQAVIDKVFPITDDMSTRVFNKVSLKREELMSAYNNEDNRNFIGTAYGLINAYADFVSHFENRKTKDFEENRFMYVTFNPMIMMNFIKNMVSVI